MANIYTNSYLNIAATAAKDSTAGCFNDREIKYFFGGVSISSFQIPHDGHGVSKVFVGPSFEPTHHRFTTSGKRRYNHPAASANDALPLLTRAWVYQERMLASRTLHLQPARFEVR
ncbi:putative het domain-containing protein [Botrytis fragariae]|uniref:Putative het domain-containing protein n=1 Tax=Botrytis fragariae TaxID=1964551 RepID=A0A8H6AU25_9HELO|nr:putative het domain-containing protein [Botrytis fragariae]KAF5873731.1 putative het domain-containing protein [Botrytis fragariae]